MTLVIKPKTLKHCRVVADPQRITQVLINLIDNAIKYGKEEGKVILEIEEENSSGCFEMDKTPMAKI